MEGLSPFETQQNSYWFQSMLTQAKNNFGHKDRSWPMRGMLCFGEAGIEGRTLTGNEIEWMLEPYIGPAEDRHSINNMVRRAQNKGILRPTGTKRKADGVRMPYPEYSIVGHLEIDPDRSGNTVVRMCEHSSQKRRSQSRPPVRLSDRGPTDMQTAQGLVL